MQTNRSKNAVRILVSNNIRQLIIALTGFISRTIFIKMLGADYLGVNGLFSSILGTLSLAELGFGSSIGFHLYKPLSENNYDEINKLMGFMKKVYAVVGTVIFIIGIGLIPFLHNLVNFDNKIDINIYTVYILFLINSASSYFVSAYLQTLANAAQRNDILSNLDSFFKILSTVLCSSALIITRNYYSYLVIQFLLTIAHQFYLRYKIIKVFPSFSEHNIEKLEVTKKKRIFKDVYSIMVDRLSNTLSSGFDTMIISAFVSTTLVGLISNYTMISSLVISVAVSFAVSTYAGIGDLIANEDTKRQIEVYKLIDFINYYILYFCVICLCVLLSPFVTLWLGHEYVVEYSVVFCVIFDSYIYNLLWPTWGFKDGMGLFKYGKFLKLIRGIANILLSVLLCYFKGAYGVYFASLITNLFICIPMFVRIVYKYGFHQNPTRAICRKFIQIGFAGVMIFVTKFICDLMGNVTIPKFIGMMFISGVFPSIVFYLFYRNSEEWKEFEKTYIRKVLNKVLRH